VLFAIGDIYDLHRCSGDYEGLLSRNGKLKLFSSPTICNLKTATGVINIQLFVISVIIIQITTVHLLLNVLADKI
jgi:hypothetical protein